METVKAVLVGESGVGKTSIISRFITDSFDPEVLSSSSAQFISKTIKLNEQTSIKFDIWDTAGQEKFRSLAKIFYKDAKIIIYVYDITDKKSFDEIKNYWYKETSENFTGDVILALIGNKIDLYENEQVTDEEGKKFANQINAIFKTTSALSNIGINWLFENLGKKVLNPNYDYTVDDNKNDLDFNIKKENVKNDKIKLNSVDNNKNHNIKKCC